MASILVHEGANRAADHGEVAQAGGGDISGGVKVEEGAA